MAAVHASDHAADPVRVSRGRGQRDGGSVAGADEDHLVDPQAVEEARQRWPLLAARVVHRVGALTPAEQIVLVATATAHRHDAFAAAEFIMDFLKTSAPFWKKEQGVSGAHWIDARDSDQRARERWQR